MPGGRRLSPAPSPATGARGSPGAPPNPPPGGRRLRAPELSGAGAAGPRRGGCCQPGPRGPRAARCRSPEAAARGRGHPSPGTSSPALPPPGGAAGRARAPKSHQDLADRVGWRMAVCCERWWGHTSHRAVPQTPTPPLPPRVLPLSPRPRWLHGCPRRPARHRWQVRGVSPAKQGHGEGHPGYRRAGGSWGNVPIAPPGRRAARPRCPQPWQRGLPANPGRLLASGMTEGTKGTGGDGPPC